ncbi:MAG: hypothetical protein COZ16_11030, partial [Flavobacteriaceae bacterium CG_4_10_14_3_um_filter_31_253]
MSPQFLKSLFAILLITSSQLVIGNSFIKAEKNLKTEEISSLWSKHESNWKNTNRFNQDPFWIFTQSQPKETLGKNKKQPILKSFSLTNFLSTYCGIEKANGGGFSTKVTSVINNGGSYTIEILVSHDGCGGPSCKELSHFSIKANPGSYSNVSWEKVSGGNINGNIEISLGNNDPFDGFKLDNVSGIGDGNAGSFKITYTLNALQKQDFLAKAGNNYTQIASFSIADFEAVMDCLNPPCTTAENTTSTDAIIENETKTLIGSPVGGTWSIVAGGGSINGSTYTPANITSNRNVTIRYTIAEDGSCPETTKDVSFTVTPVCEIPTNTVPGNQTTTENIDSFAFNGVSVSDPLGNPLTVRLTVANGTLSVIIRVSGGRNLPTRNGPGDITFTGSANVINGYLSTLSYIPNPNFSGTDTLTMTSFANCNPTETDVDTIDIVVTPICTTAENTTSTDAIIENETKTLIGSPVGGTWSIVAGGGSINGSTYTPANITSNRNVTIRYTIAEDGSCPETTSDVSFTVTPIIVQPNESFYPLEPALCFNICVEKDLNVSNASVVGAVAVGGNMTVNGDYSISTIECGCFEVENLKIGLLVNGRVKYPLDGTRNSGVIRIENSNQYVKIGDDNNESISWFKDPQNAPAPIRITPSRTYDVNSYIQLTGTTPSLGLDPENNPIFQDNLVDFGSMFQQLRTNSLSLSQNPHNASLKDSNNNPISNTGLPANVEIFLNDGVNYLNISGADLNAVQNFTAQNSTSTDKLLVINVDAPGNFDWNPWVQNGFIPQDATNIIYNFYNTSTLTILGTNSIFGTIMAPNADIIRPAFNQPKSGVSSKTNAANQGTISGQIIGKSLTQNSGTVDCSKFESSVSSLKSSLGTAPIADFTVDNTTNCLEGNEFNFTNTSNTNGVAQPNDPITYLWNFGDGTTSTFMNPTKSYAGAGTYNVTLTATNTFGISYTSTQVIVLQPINHPAITQSVTNTGNGSITREFTITNAAYFDSFEWSLDGGVTMVQQNQNPGVFTFETAGTYTVTVYGTKDGCSRSLEIPVTVASAEVTTGNAGGVESESLGDAISKIYVNRKKNSVPTEFVKSEENLYNKALLKKAQPHQGKGQTMLDMFPEQLVAGDVANVTSPTDILDYTIADEVLSVDFSVNGKTKGVVLGIKTSDKVYNHTKASCDRLRGAEILTVKSVKLEGYNFLMQAIKQRNGVVEHAISFAVAKNNNDADYSMQTNWYVNNYTKFNDMYNFQVWATNPEDTQKLVKDILANLKSFIPVTQNEKHRMPKTYAAKVSRVADNLVLKLRSDKGTIGGEIEMEEKYSETAGNVKQRYNPINAKAEQIVLIDIKDAYEYDGLIKVN